MRGLDPVKLLKVPGGIQELLRGTALVVQRDRLQLGKN